LITRAEPFGAVTWLLIWPLSAGPGRVICIPLRPGLTAGRQPDLPVADAGMGAW